MNQENQNNINGIENNNIGATTPVNDKFMRVDDINKINQPVMQPVQPNHVVTQPQIVEPVVSSEPPVVNNEVSAQPQIVNTTSVEPRVLEPTMASAKVQEVKMQDNDNNAMINENLKKVEINNYTPPSKFKVTLLIILFIALIAFVIFLPQISTIVRERKSGLNYEKEKIITTGKLICTLDTNTDELDKNYELTFSFVDNKLTKDKFVITTRGDSTTESSLDDLNEKCNVLKKETTTLEGISVRCDYTDNKLIETQSFDLDTIDVEKLDAAFTEAGGMLPSYRIDQNIDEIEKNMKATGYTCERE